MRAAPGLAAALALTAPACGAGDEPGWYAAAQATRGAAVYAAHCAACHGAGLQGGSAAPLGPPALDDRWAGLPLADLLHVVRTQMPWGAPGSLTSQAYLDVTAFLLAASGYPAGESPLVDDPAQLAPRVLGR